MLGMMLDRPISIRALFTSYFTYRIVGVGLSRDFCGVGRSARLRG